MPDSLLLVFLFGGLLLMALAGDLLVRGALGIGRALGVSPLLAGIFIVGFGTSAPEMMVAVNAVMTGNEGLAFGNIVGSNIANVFLVAALPALIFPVMAGGPGQRWAVLAMLVATAAWIGMTAIMPLVAMIGICFLAILAGYTGLSIILARRAEAKGKPTGVDADAATGGAPLWRALIYVPVGAAALVWSSNLIIMGGEGIARFYQVPEEWIGLTLLAVGTSLPEIGASLAAAFRKRGDVLIGNIVGSNIFNILGAGGLVALFGPVQVAGLFHNYDHWVMGIAAVVLAGLVFTKARIGRLTGVLFLLIYAAYIYGLVRGYSLAALFDLVV
ncbi:sodium:calcium antiporter [Hyphomonas sp.]|uniref:sodium:calcium antiporter n=1 Tax=Hyphomonas sp. TaxID=87 RepID=UPI00391BD638